MTEIEAVLLFAERGMFCRYLDGFVMEIKSLKDEAKLRELVEVWGGRVNKPRPNEPRTWWRLIGKNAESLWLRVRGMMPAAKVVAGDAKLNQCQQRRRKK